MEIMWEIELQDIEKLLAFFDAHQDSPFIQTRIERNIEQPNFNPSKSEFFETMIACLITTQQRSGPDSAVTKFLLTKPFPLSYEFCVNQSDLFNFVRNTISDFGGIRRFNKIAEAVEVNFLKLEGGLWDNIYQLCAELEIGQTVQNERRAADFVAENLFGFGPKQSRNLLQSLGLTKYEIPIDSRITKWLNDFGFPVKLSSTALSDRNYYSLISDGIQALCNEAGVTPCVLDAVIFASFDRGGWTDENVVW